MRRLFHMDQYVQVQHLGKRPCSGDAGEESLRVDALALPRSLFGACNPSLNTRLPRLFVVLLQPRYDVEHKLCGPHVRLLNPDRACGESNLFSTC